MFTGDLRSPAVLAADLALPQPTASPLPRERASRLRPEPARPQPCSAQTLTTARRPPLAAYRTARGSPPSARLLLQFGQGRWEK